MNDRLASGTHPGRGWIDPDTVSRPAFVLAEQHRPGATPVHAHRRAQLLYVSAGVLTVTTDHGSWVIPPLRGVWVLPGVQHSAASKRAYSLCTLYVEADRIALPEKCLAVDVGPLVREMLLAAAAFGFDYEPEGADARLIQVILDRVQHSNEAALHLPECHDERLRPITDRLKRDPADGRPLAAWARTIGMSERAAARAFVADLGMTFGEWRQQLRLLRALEELGDGHSVTEVALTVGYSDVSAFITMFKAALGATPRQYHRRRPDPGRRE